jgi:hypothetical protein
MTRLILATMIQGYSYTQRLRFAEEAGCVSLQEYARGASHIKKTQGGEIGATMAYPVCLVACWPHKKASGCGGAWTVAMAEHGLWLWRSIEGGIGKATGSPKRCEKHFYPFQQKHFETKASHK